MSGSESAPVRGMRLRKGIVLGKSLIVICLIRYKSIGLPGYGDMALVEKRHQAMAIRK